MKYAPWAVRRRLARLGWRELAGITLILFAGVMQLTVVRTAQGRIDEIRQKTLSVRDLSRRSGTDAANGTQRVEAQIDGFYALLPEASSAPDWLGEIHKAAHGASISLDQAEYRMIAERDGRLGSYELNLPVRGTYVQVRQFVTRVLNAVPAAALDDLVIKRETIGTPTVDANIRITLFLRAR